MEQKLVDANKVLEFVSKELRYYSGYPSCSEGDYLYECAVTDARNKITEFLKAQPTIDAVPVRCGECKHFNTAECAMTGYCDGCDCKVDLGFDETGYCSHGEQKTKSDE